MFSVHWLSFAKVNKAWTVVPYGIEFILQIMNIVEARFSGLIECNIHKDDPSLFPLQSLPGWALINPLLYVELGVNANPFGFPFSTVALYNDLVFLKTGTLLFTCPLTDEEAFMTL